MEFELVDFVLASLLMGVGIGTDVALATIIRSHQLKTLKVILIWVIGVSLTHTIFPMLGYVTTYVGVQLLPELTPIIGVVAFICIFWFLKDELLSLFEDTPADNSNILVTLGLILAVSWDALWSGPAKSAQVIGWPELFVWGSFILVGLSVSLLTIFSMYYAKRLFVMFSTNGKHRFTLLWLQYSVISYFGWLALLRYSLGLQVSWLLVLGLSALIMFLVMRIISLRQYEQAASYR